MSGGDIVMAMIEANYYSIYLDLGYQSPHSGGGEHCRARQTTNRLDSLETRSQTF